MKTLYNYLQSLHITDEARVRIAKIVTDGIMNTSNSSLPEYKARASKFRIPDNFSVTKDVLELMETVNSMVKHPTCPKNLRNRFYGYKTRVIEELLDQGRVSDVYSEGDCYSLVIDGKYKFHQLKATHPHWVEYVEILGKRPYAPYGEPIPFSIETYTDFQLSAMYFLANARMKELDKLSLVETYGRSNKKSAKHADYDPHKRLMELYDELVGFLINETKGESYANVDYLKMKPGGVAELNGILIRINERKKDL